MLNRVPERISTLLPGQILVHFLSPPGIEAEEARYKMAGLLDVPCTSERAVDQFLGMGRSLDLKHLNVTSIKRRLNRGELEKGVVVTSEACNRIYSSRYAWHFYPEEAIQGFMRKWASF